MAKNGISDRTFVVTGTLASMSRKEAEAAITATGGRVTSAVSSNTDVLVTGDKESCKITKARSSGLEVRDDERNRARSVNRSDSRGMAGGGAW